MFAVHLNYSITDLDELINVTSITLASHVTSFTFPSIAPGRSYVATIAFENEIGLSENNPIGELREKNITSYMGKIVSAFYDKRFMVTNIIFACEIIVNC